MSLVEDLLLLQGYIHAEENVEECWITLTCQLNPKGWIDTTFGHQWYFMHAFGIKFLEMIGCLDGEVKGPQQKTLLIVQQMDLNSEQETKESSKVNSTPKSVENAKAFIF